MDELKQAVIVIWIYKTIKAYITYLWGRKIVFFRRTQFLV